MEMVDRPLLLRRIARVLVCVSLTLGMTAAWKPSPAAAWPRDYILGRVGLAPQLAFSAEGDGVAVWSGPSTDPVRAVRVASDGPFGGLQTLSPAGVVADAPRVAVDAEGDSLIAWIAEVGGYKRLQARSMTHGGVLGPVRTLSRDGDHALDPAVLVSPAGDATLTWRGNVAGSDRIYMRSVPAAGALGPIRSVSVPGVSATDADMARMGDGSVIWVWEGDGDIYARVLSPTAVFGPVQRLSGAGTFRQPRVSAMGLSATVVWTKDVGTGDRVQSRRIGADGALGAVRNVSPARLDASEPRVSVRSDGVSVIAYLDADARLRMRTLSTSDELGPSQFLAGLGEGDPVLSSELVAGPDGRVAAAWERVRASCAESPCTQYIQTRMILSTGERTQIWTLGGVRGGCGMSMRGRVAATAGDEMLVVWCSLLDDIYMTRAP